MRKGNQVRQSRLRPQEITVSILLNKLSIFSPVSIYLICLILKHILVTFIYVQGIKYRVLYKLGKCSATEFYL
ncbi:mCG147482 [Mus musculus]|jgi:hypothetical protein|uniref:Uncharacterized protein n=1 Tax=Mus musculus TaxID=10090 RepID=Q3TDG6_MOUSE|nr:mCG147482 [Mus musculus]BAE41636.1 unnamed protein product [Mus musculus]